MEARDPAGSDRPQPVNGRGNWVRSTRSAPVVDALPAPNHGKIIPAEPHSAAASRPLGRSGCPEAGNRPRVLVVGPLFPQGGGVGMVDQTLLTCGLAGHFDMQHLNIERGPAGAGKEGTLALVNMYYFVAQLWHLLTLLVRQRPAILHQSVTDSIGFWKESCFMLLARVFGVRVVAHVHGNRLEPQYRTRPAAVRWLMRAALALPNAVIVLNEHYRVLLAGILPPGTPLVVVPNSVDMAVAQATGNQASEPKAGCVVLFIGFVGSRKGVPDALRALPLVRQKLPGARFVFAGPLDSAPDRASVEAACKAAEAAGDAVFPGLVAGPIKVALLAQASIFILPSYHENLPVAILEAMAMGLPIVTTPVAGIPEIVEDGHNGFLVPPGDAEALADRIVRLGRDPELRQSMGQANVAKFREQYHPSVFAARIEELYCQLLANGRSDGATVSAV